MFLKIFFFFVKPSNLEPNTTENSKPEVKGDFGMGRKEDRDLYANRSSK